MQKEQQEFEAFLESEIIGSDELPVISKEQVLPLTSLSWKTFEQLCCRLVARDPNTEETPYLYGMPGEDQKGIDIVAKKRVSGSVQTWCYQCKNHQQFPLSKFKKAIKELEYEADRFVFLLACEVGTELRIIANDNDVELWDVQNISSKLKSYPDLVADFFGVAWMKAFCVILEMDQFAKLDSNGSIIYTPLERKPPLQMPRRVDHFHDRDAERAWLLQSLQPGHMVTIFGARGMGKTALVSQFLSEIICDKNTVPEAFPDGVIFHCFYGQPEINVALEHFIRSLGEDPMPPLLITARRVLSRRRLLLILDGAEEANNLEEILSVLSQEITVLITTWRRSNAADTKYILNLRPLSTPEAIEVVQDWGGSRAQNTSIVTKICGCVGNLPLALRLVGRYLALNEEEAHEYLDWLQQEPISSLDHGPSSHESIPLLLDRSTARLSPNAQQSLRIIGLLALAPFASDLITKILEQPDRAVKLALNELIDYGLLIRPENQYEVSHSLIHTYAKEKLLAAVLNTTPEHFFERAINALDEAFPDVTYENWATCAKLIPHIQNCISIIEEYGYIASNEMHLLNRAGHYLQEIGQYTLSDPLKQRMLAICEHVFDNIHPITATSLNNLADLYRIQGRYQEAEAFLLRALNIRERTLGVSDPETATSLNNLALLYDDQGKFDKANPLYQRALALRKQTLGVNNQNTAQSMNNLGALYDSLGRYNEAEPLLVQALAIRRQVLSDNHPDIAQTMNNLARLYCNLEEFEKAEELYQQALDIRESVLGPNHPGTATVLQNLSSLYQTEKKYEKAEPLLIRALSVREQMLGFTHPDTTFCQNNLALLYQAQGKAEQAEVILSQALVSRKQWPDVNPLDTAMIQANLAGLYLLREEYEKAESLLTEVLATRVQVLGASHFKVAETLYTLAKLYQIQKRYEDAERVLERALIIRKQELGANHPDVVETLYELAMVYKEQRKLEDMEDILPQVIAGYKQASLVKHPQTPLVFNSLASLYFAQGKYGEATQMFKYALKVYAQTGMIDLDTIATLNNFASLLQAQKRYAEAEKLFKQALDMCDQVREADTLKATALNNMGYQYFLQGKHHEAEKCLKQALTIYEQIENNLDMHYSSSLNSLAHIYYVQRRYDEAEPLLKKALSICENVLGSENLEVASKLSKLATLYEVRKRYEEAEAALKRTLLIKERVLGIMHLDTEKSRNNLMCLYLLQGKNEEVARLRGTVIFEKNRKYQKRRRASRKKKSR